MDKLSWEGIEELASTVYEEIAIGLGHPGPIDLFDRVISLISYANKAD